MLLSRADAVRWIGRVEGKLELAPTIERTGRIEPRGQSLQLFAPAAEPAARVEESKQSSKLIGGEEQQVESGHLLAEEGNVHQRYDPEVEQDSGQCDPLPGRAKPEQESQCKLHEQGGLGEHADHDGIVRQPLQV